MESSQNSSQSDSPRPIIHRHVSPASIVLALPAQNRSAQYFSTPSSRSPRYPRSDVVRSDMVMLHSGYRVTGSREDWWSEAATVLLIEAWAERSMNLSRGSLSQQHWKEVADEVSLGDNSGRIPKTDVQCKNRIDTVKKKYKAEKAKIAVSGGVSSWRFYDRMDELIGPVVTPALVPVPSVRSTRIQNQKKRRPKFESDSEAEPPSPDSTDSLPPETKYPYKRARTHREIERDSREIHGDRTTGDRWGDAVRELTKAIVKFGELYENAERLKLEQMMEIEKQRMKFAKEAEAQRMQFFMKTQLLFSQRKNGRHINDSHHCHRSNNDDNHHSDTSI